MLELKHRNRDNYGNIIFTEEGILELLYSGYSEIPSILIENSNDVMLFNQVAKIFDIAPIKVYSPLTESIEEFDKRHQKNWRIPPEYQFIDLEKYFKDKCKTEEEINRINIELKLFKSKNMEMVLRALIYLVDLMREKKIVWGVGRGSSCASYCLYLIGIHKVNSLKYGLDIKEFLKNNN